MDEKLSANQHSFNAGTCSNMECLDSYSSMWAYETTLLKFFHQNSYNRPNDSNKSSDSN